MKKVLLLLFIGCGVIFNGNLFSQDEDPAKILSFTEKKDLDDYMARKKWTYEKKHTSDSIDGEFYLYKRKSLGGGIIYCSIHLQKYMHYQVFFDQKKPYSLVLEYDDFLKIPTGKSRFNESMENKVYAIKTVEFDDPNESRNKNLFFGKIVLSDHHPDAVVEKGKIDIKDYHKDEKDSSNKEDERKDDLDNGGGDSN